ncbi:hypothetical protein IAU59_000741 [Kwoniella sp. CBS 9459]
MKLSITASVLSVALLAKSAVALQPGDVPLNVAVRSVNGEIKHFYEKDEIEYYNRKRAEVGPDAVIERQDPQSDLYPVSNDGSGVKAFQGGGTSETKRDETSAILIKMKQKRQDVESDSYPVSNDGTGLKAFKGAGSE